MVKELGKVVLYHANWCGHCNNMMPEWDEFAHIAGSDGLGDVLVEKISDAAMKDIDKKRVQGFPTINLIDKEGGIYEYAGSRTKESLLDHTKHFKEYYIEGKLPNNNIQAGGGRISSGRISSGRISGGGCSCGMAGGSCGCGQYGGVSMIEGNQDREKYYEMKYYKYKAKIAKLTENKQN